MSTNGSSQTEQLHVETQPLSFILQKKKNQLKIGQKPQYKTWYLKSDRVETKENM